MIQGLCDSIKHRKRMPFVISIFKPADGGLGRSDKSSQFFLIEAGILPKVMKYLRHFCIDPFGFKRRYSVRSVLDELTVKDFNGVIDVFLFFILVSLTLPRLIFSEY